MKPGFGSGVLAHGLAVSLVLSTVVIGSPRSASALPSSEPGDIGTRAHTRVSAEIFSSPDLGLEGEFWNETVDGAGGIATSNRNYPFPGSGPISCSSQCGGWEASAHGSTDVAAGRLSSFGYAKMHIGNHHNAAGNIFVDGAAYVDDTITLSSPATVTLQGSVTGSVLAGNTDQANQGNDPDAELLAEALFFALNDGPCEFEWCPPYTKLGGLSEPFEPTVTTSADPAPTIVDQPFEINVDLPSGTSYFNAQLAASIDYQVFGHGDRLVSKVAALDFANSLEFEILVPEGVTATSGSGLLPLTEDTQEDLAARNRAQDMKDGGATCTEIAEELMVEFELTPLRTAHVLKHVECTISEIVGALDEVYEMDIEEIAGVLKEMNLSATEIAPPLKDDYGMTAEMVVELFKELAFTAEDIAAALKEAYEMSAEMVVELFKELAFTAEDIAAALKEAYALAGAMVAALLEESGFTANKTAKALSVVFAAGAQKVISWLKSAGYSALDSVRAAKQVFSAGGQKAMSWVRSAGYPAVAAAQAAKQVFSAGGQKVISWVKSAGYSALDSVRAAKQVFSAGAKQAMSWARSAGYPIVAMADALQVVYSKSAHIAAKLFRQIGYGPSEVAKALKQSYGLGKAKIKAILLDIGYALSAILKAICKIFNC